MDCSPRAKTIHLVEAPGTVFARRCHALEEGYGEKRHCNKSHPHYRSVHIRPPGRTEFAQRRSLSEQPQASASSYPALEPVEREGVPVVKAKSIQSRSRSP